MQQVPFLQSYFMVYWLRRFTAALRCCLYLQVVMLPYPLTESFYGVLQVQAGKGTFLEKRIFPEP